MAKNLRQQMIKEAKRIAYKVYETISYTPNDDNVVVFISPDEQRRREIELILSNHSKFRANEFRKMVEDFSRKISEG